MVSQNGHANTVAQFLFFQKPNNPVQNLLIELYTGIFIYLFTIYIYIAKGVPVSTFRGGGRNLYFSFLNLEIAHELEGIISVDP